MLVTLLNTLRQNHSKPLLGCLNPTLYASKSAGLFNDITSGTNNCCSDSHSGCCSSTGFSTAAGWDPVTGLGS